MLLQRLMLPISIAFLIAVGLWIHLMMQDVAPEVSISADSPEYEVRDIRVTELSPRGTASRTLEAPQLRHFGQRDLTELESPVVTLFSDGTETWRITGESGRVLNATKEIFLDGEVHINRIEGPGIEPVMITTRNLHMLQEKNYVESTENTVIATTGHRIQGVGVKAWLNRPARVKLLAQIRGHHEFE